MTPYLQHAGGARQLRLEKPDCRRAVLKHAHRADNAPRHGPNGRCHAPGHDLNGGDRAPRQGLAANRRKCFMGAPGRRGGSSALLVGLRRRAELGGEQSRAGGQRPLEPRHGFGLDQHSAQARRVHPVELPAEREGGQGHVGPEGGGDVDHDERDRLGAR
eukprot:scaffold19114_cov118-Isochrysis_galbana.AAC.11